MQSHYVVFPSPWLRVEINYHPLLQNSPHFCKRWLAGFETVNYIKWISLAMFLKNLSYLLNSTERKREWSFSLAESYQAVAFLCTCEKTFSKFGVSVCGLTREQFFDPEPHLISNRSNCSTGLKTWRPLEEHTLTHDRRRQLCFAQW